MEEKPEAVRIELLGGFRVSVGPRTVGEGGWRLKKARSLVKLLALAKEHRLHREQVVEWLWPDLDAEAAINNLRQALHVARRALEPAPAGASRHLRLLDDWLELCPEGQLWVDAEAFEEAAARARRSAREPAAYRAAVDLYAGDLLPRDRYERWAEDRREGLRLLYLTLLVELAGLYEERENFEPAIGALGRVVEIEPTHEEAYVGLMRLYAASGRRREAVLQYERLRKALSEELGVEPGEAVRRLHEEVLLGRSSPARSRPEDRGAPVAPPIEPRRHNLPVERTSFVGREEEMAEVERLLRTTRLLTLTGVGGSGKTRLALALAKSSVGACPDGAWLVELASLSDPAQVPRAVAQALGVREQPGRLLSATLEDFLSSKSLLLVLDNCEHLIEAAARLVETLLDSCAGLRVLATSRETLNVAGELVWRVPPLSVPDSGRPPAVEELARFESVRLFVERARYRQPAFLLTPENARVVGEICRRLEGIPLAIELAAVRVGGLSVEQISERLKDSLKLLAGGRTAPPRQRTLKGALDWSYELLDEPEKELFGRLSVFAGGWTLEAAEAVGAGGGIEEGDVLELLSGLVDKSLVVAEAGPEGAARYRMLEPVRQYGGEKLEASGEAADVRRRHASFFLELAEEAEPALLGPGQVAWLERLDLEHDNLRAALGWLGEEREVEQGLRLGGALGRFWWHRGHFTEGRAWLEELLGFAGASGRTAARAKALYALGALINRNANHATGDPEVARSRLEESIEIYRELGDESCTAAVLRELGSVGVGVGDWEAARSSLEEGLGLDRRSGNEYGVALTRTYLGILDFFRGDYGPARTHFEEGIGSLRGSGNKLDLNTNLFFLGCLACDRGDYAEARTRFAEMMEGNPLQQRRWTAPIVMLGYARLAAGEGQAARALRLAGAAEALQQTVGGSTQAPAFAAYLRRGLEPAWRALGEEEAAAAFEQGRAMTLEGAVEYALSEEEGPPTEKAPAPEEPPAGRRQAAALTPREREVAILLARELTNRQIASELVISERTVATHVHKILKKLGLRSRTQIAAWTIEQRLLS